MSIEREIQEAFGELASEVRSDGPALDRAVGRARRRNRDRRIVFASLAISLAVATIVGVPRLVGDPPSRGLTLRPGPSLTPSTGSVAPSPTKTAIAPPATGTPSVSSSPSTTPPLSGLRVELSLPSGIATAEIVEATVRIQDDAGSVSHVAVLWGETPQQFAILAPSCAPPTGPPHPAQETRVLRHSYRTPGTYPIRVQVITGHCQDTPPETVEVQGKISIQQGGATPSNGPLAPTVHIEDRRHLYEERPPLEAWFYLGGGDEDGFVRRVVVDWGDGKVETLVNAPLSECEEPPGQWPSTYLTGQEAHHLYAPGTYTLTVTVTSVGCDGLDVQTRSDDFELTSPS